MAEVPEKEVFARDFIWSRKEVLLNWRYDIYRGDIQK